MWLIVPYARDRRWSGRVPQGRYCIADDATQDGWREVEILGNHAIVVATAKAGQAIGALPGVERLPAGMSLADTLGDLTLAERRHLRDVALTLGYTLDELRGQFGQQVDLSTVRVATFLNFLRQRRVKPRFDAELDEIVFDGAARACEPLQIEAFNAFGDAGVLDAFDRANSASMGADWAGSVFGDTSCRIVSNTAGPSADSGNQYSGNIWRYSTTASPQTYGGTGVVDECWMTISTDSSTEGGFEVLLGIDVSITPDCYSYFGNHGNSSSTSINRYDNGSFTQLGASITQGMASGYKVGISRDAGTIQSWLDTGSGWSSNGSRSDSTYTAAGYLAMELQRSSNAHRIDDFGGGNQPTGGGGGGSTSVFVPTKMLMGVGI